MKYIAPEYIINKIETEDVITASNFTISNIFGTDAEGNPTDEVVGQKGEYSVGIEDLLG